MLDGAGAFGAGAGAGFAFGTVLRVDEPLRADGPLDDDALDFEDVPPDEPVEETFVDPFEERWMITGAGLGA